MTAEEKAAIDNVMTALQEMRAADKERTEQIAKTGRAAAEISEKVDRANAEVTRLHQEVLAMRRRELALPSGVAVGGLTDEEAAASFMRTLRIHRPNSVPAAFNGAAMVAYRTAVDSYIRQGTEFMPNEMKAAMQVGQDGKGGFFVHPTMDGRIVARVYETSPMREICSQITIGSDAYKFLFDDDETSCGYVSELGTRSEGDTPDIAEGRISVHEIYAEPHATVQLLEDAEVDVESWLVRKAGDKFSRFENAEFITADGAEEIRGILGRTINTTADATRARGQLQYIPTGASGDFASTSPGDALITALYTLKATYRTAAQWLMSSLTEASVRKLKDGDGNYLWQPDYRESGGAVLLGRPVKNAEDMPAIAANSYSIAVGDFKRGYLIVDRRGLSLLRDPYTTKGRVKFHLTKRVGGDVIDSEAIKVLKFAAS